MTKTVKMNNNTDKPQKDSLQQLETLLAKDAKASGAESNGFLSKLVLTGIIVRLSVFVVLVVGLYLVGVIDDLRFVAVAAAVFGGLEGVRLWKLMEYHRTKNKQVEPEPRKKRRKKK